MGTQTAHAKQRVTRLPKWLIYALLSMFWWGLFGFLAKIGSERIPPADMQIFFTVGMVPLILGALIRLKFRVDTDRRGLSFGLLIGVLSTIGFIAYVAAMARGKASIVGVVTALFPLLTIALALLVLKEKLNRIQLIGAALAMVAIVILSE